MLIMHAMQWQTHLIHISTDTMATMNTILRRNNGTTTIVTSTELERGAPVPGGLGLATDDQGSLTSA